MEDDNLGVLQIEPSRSRARIKEIDPFPSIVISRRMGLMVSTPMAEGKEVLMGPEGIANGLPPVHYLYIGL